jgi:hypothetical protein
MLDYVLLIPGSGNRFSVVKVKEVGRRQVVEEDITTNGKRTQSFRIMGPSNVKK